MRVSALVILSLGALAVVGADVAAAANLKNQYRKQEEAACYDDAMKFCQEFVPDEDKIGECMARNRAGLSPTCGKVFDEGMKRRQAGQE